MTINDQIEDLTTALATSLRHSLGAEVRATIRYLILLLGEGRSVSVERIAVALEQSPDKVATTLCQLPNIELDEHDNVVGAGLNPSSNASPLHYARPNHVYLARLGRPDVSRIVWATVQVESPCVATGTLVRAKITPTGVEHIEPSEAVVSLLVPAVSADIRGSFLLL